MTSDLHTNLWRVSGGPTLDLPALEQDLTVDLVVIGGGFTGCAAALEAAEAGATVALLEGETIGHGGSGRNVGLVNAGLWLPPEQIRAQMGAEAGCRLIDALAVAPEKVFRLIERFSIDCEATRKGTLHLAHAPKGFDDLQDRFRQGIEIGAPVQLLNRDEAIRRTGSEAFHGALFDPRAGTIQPLAYCRGLARAALGAGAQLFENSPAEGIRHDGSDWLVRVKGHVIRARSLLMAANAYLGEIPGAPKPAFVPFYYCQFATAPLTAVQRAQILPGGEGCWDTALVMSSIRLDQAGRLIIGGVGQISGPGGAIHNNWARRKLAALYPTMTGVPLEYHWEGRIAMTSDYVPKLVEIGPNALSAFGFSGRGIGPGTVFGQAAARALLTGTRDELPLASCAQHSESLRGARAAYYECGASLTHAINPAPFRPIRVH